jgi:hypothetical protein
MAGLPLSGLPGLPGLPVPTLPGLPALPMLHEMPGMTRYVGEHVEVKPYTGIVGINPLIQRKVILLATAVISEENLFSNGLFQNVYVFYRMFESMGFLPLMIVNKKPDSLEKIPWYMRDIRLITVEEIAKNPIPVSLYIEVGMSIDSQMRKFLKMCGARIAKLYLGNILNIDVETPIFYPTTAGWRGKGDLLDSGAEYQFPEVFLGASDDS